MTQFEGGFVSAQLDRNHVVLVPPRRIIDLDWKVPESLPTSGQNLGGCANNRLPQFRRGSVGLWQSGKRIIRGEGNGSPVGLSSGINQLGKFSTEVSSEFRSAHRTRSMPIPTQAC